MCRNVTLNFGRHFNITTLFMVSAAYECHYKILNWEVDLLGVSYLKAIMGGHGAHLHRAYKPAGMYA